MNKLVFTNSILKIKFTFIFLFFTSVIAISQTSHPIKFSAQIYYPTVSIMQLKTLSHLDKINTKFYGLIQFKEIPTEKEVVELKKLGVDLLKYIPKNTYYSRIDQNVKLDDLKAFNIASLTKIKADFKLSKTLLKSSFSAWALDGKNKVKLNGVFFNEFSTDYISNKLNELNADIISINSKEIIQFSIDITKLNLLYSLPEFYYFEEIDAPSEPENLVETTNHRGNVLATTYNSGLKLDGTGITVMLQDNSKLDNHIDYTGRFTNHSSAVQTGDHGEHTGGTIGGAGNLDPTTRGMAFGADVLVYNFSNTNYNTVPALIASNDLTITSKSYGNGLNSGYNSLASQLDQQTRMNPQLIHVFSTGNSNGSGSTAAGSQWYNITGGHKSGKNVIAVGNVSRIDNISSSSSHGPTDDGRIKPDICAVGSNVNSTVDPNDYDTKSGTSMACPGVAGTLAQLYQGYKELNNGVNPNSGLIKASILNTAYDLGNTGPDYVYGWGRINAKDAYRTISDHTYFEGSISQGNTITESLMIPTGVSQVNVMVYWLDYEGTAGAGTALVNDIDMTITDPSSNIHQPWVLFSNYNSSDLANPATQGIDHLNNMEQITINSPSPGAYTIQLNGFSIPQGPQQYFIVYQLLTDEVELTYPIGGEHFDHSANEIIRWDAHDNIGNFSLEYSIDNGINWNLISNSISGNSRYYLWNVPNQVTGQALIKVSRGTNQSQSHQPFSIIGVPSNLQVDWVCIDSMQVSWNSVPGATSYEVSLLGNYYMDSVGTSNTTSLIIPVLSNQSHWWSVKALGTNNCIGRRAIAKFQPSGVFNCIINTDVGLINDDVFNGTSFQSCIYSNIFNVSVWLKNGGTTSLSNIPIHYQLNNGTIITENYTGVLNIGDSILYTFSSQISVLNGINNLSTWSDLIGDGNFYNDSITNTFNYSNSSPVTLPLTEDFESFNLCGINSNCEAEVCLTMNQFVNATNGIIDDIDWRTNEGPTPSNNTGPFQDFKPGTVFGNYMYLEPSGFPSCSNKEAHLITPCIDLQNSGVLKFAYHMLGVDIGSLHIDILHNGIWVNDITPAIIGNQGSLWKTRTINLINYAGGIVQIRFRGITGNDYRSDIAIDDIDISSSVGIDQAKFETFKIFPNPSNGIFNYKYIGNESLDIYITDINGKIIMSKTISPQNNGIIDLENFADGIYIIKTIHDTYTNNLKIIKQ